MHTLALDGQESRECPQKGAHRLSIFRVEEEEEDLLAHLQQ